MLTPDGHAAPRAADINPADFTTNIDNPLLPLSSFAVLEFDGLETDPDSGEAVETRVVMTTLPESDNVGGVPVLVVRDDAYENGELIESTLDYFAQHLDGSVYYFGERVDNYVDGEIANHNGSWLAGENGALPGIYMPAEPYVGLVFEQEQAPGIAEDRSTVLAIDLEKTVPAGTFTGCIETEDLNPLDGHVEYKFYCPNAGFVREEFKDGDLELVSIEFASTPVPTPSPAPTPTPAPTASPAPSPAPTPTPAALPSAGGADDSRATPWLAYTTIAGAIAAATLLFALRRRVRW